MGEISSVGSSSRPTFISLENGERNFNKFNHFVPSSLRKIAEMICSFFSSISSCFKIFPLIVRSTKMAFNKLAKWNTQNTTLVNLLPSVLSSICQMFVFCYFFVIRIIHIKNKKNGVERTEKTQKSKESKEKE